MASLEYIAKRRAELASWESASSEKIKVYEHAVREGQLLRQDKKFEQSPYLLMRKIKQTRCEVCFLSGGQKYLRWKSMFSVEQDKRCLVFNICADCLEQERNSRQWNIDLSSYQSMYWLVQKLREGNQDGEVRACLQERAKQKYLVCQAQLQDTIRQISKMVEKKQSLICRQLLSELSHLTQAQCRTRKDIQQAILRQPQCTCQHQCCYCDYTGSHEDLLKLNCQYFSLKKQQNKLIQMDNLFDSITSVLSQQNLFVGVIKQTELIILDKIQVIEKAINEIIDETSSFSFLSRDFINRISLHYCSQNANLSQIDVIESSQSRFENDGVLNHLTYDRFNHFSEQLRTIELNHMPEQSQFRRKFKSLNRLQNITVNNSQIGDLLIEDTIKSELSTPKHDKIYRKLPIPAQDEACKNELNASGLINLLEMAQLKMISFNCQPKENVEFFRAIGESNIETIYWKWNIGDFFSQFNEATHFAQQKSVLPSTAPSSLLLQKMYDEGKLKNLWIGQCEGSEERPGGQREAEVGRYLRVLQKDRHNIDSLVLGQFDGISRGIDSRILNQLQTRRSLRSLLLNKIIINQDKFSSVLRSNNLLECLYINECQQLNRDVFQQIEQLSSLKKLSLIQVRKIYFTKSIRTLQVFFLQRCFGLVEEQLQAQIVKLMQDQCRFVDDDLIKKILERQIENGSSLEYLNLGYTKLTNETLRVASPFKLRALHIGGTQIDLLHLLQDLATAKFANFYCLEKLCLKDMRIAGSQGESEKASQHHNDLFSFILQYFPILSHLDLSGNARINQRAIRFGLTRLLYLKVTDTQFSKHNLHKKTEHAGTQCPYYQTSQRATDESHFSVKKPRKVSSSKLESVTSDLRIVF